MSYLGKKDLSLLERLLAKVSLVDESLAREGKKFYDKQSKKSKKGRKYFKEYMQDTRKADEIREARNRKAKEVWKIK